MEKGFCSIPIEKLVKAGWNYKVDNQELSEKLENNIKRNGQIENVIIRELDTGFFEVVNGNHRLDVLNRLGFEDVYCYNLGIITESQAKRIAIETNETRFQSNLQYLDDMIIELAKDIDIDDLEMTIPFDINKIISDSNKIEEEELTSENDKIEEMKYSILIEFENEVSAKEMSDELTERGLKCKILMS